MKSTCLCLWCRYKRGNKRQCATCLKHLYSSIGPCFIFSITGRKGVWVFEEEGNTPRTSHRTNFASPYIVTLYECELVCGCGGS